MLMLLPIAGVTECFVSLVYCSLAMSTTVLLYLCNLAENDSSLINFIPWSVRYPMLTGVHYFCITTHVVRQVKSLLYPAL